MLALHSKTQEKKKIKIITLVNRMKTGSVSQGLKEFKGAGLN
jgi:hypothetical protein